MIEKETKDTLYDIKRETKDQIKSVWHKDLKLYDIEI